MPETPQETKRKVAEQQIIRKYKWERSNSPSSDGRQRYDGTYAGSHTDRDKTGGKEQSCQEHIARQ